MASLISINELSEAIVEEMETFRDIAYETMEKIAKQVAKEGAAKLKQTSPKGRGSRKGHYADGWTVNVVKKSGRASFAIYIYNQKKPGLTHLLENGHQLRNGGRAKAFPHIQEVEDWCNEEYQRRLEAELGG